MSRSSERPLAQPTERGTATPIPATAKTAEFTCAIETKGKSMQPIPPSHLLEEHNLGGSFRYPWANLVRVYLASEWSPCISELSSTSQTDHAILVTRSPDNVVS